MRLRAHAARPASMIAFHPFLVQRGACYDTRAKHMHMAVLFLQTIRLNAMSPTIMVIGTPMWIMIGRDESHPAYRMSPACPKVERTLMPWVEHQENAPAITIAKSYITMCTV
jgi:hypothetical protein